MYELLPCMCTSYLLMIFLRLDILKILSRVLENKLKFNPDENDFYFRTIDPDTSYALTYDNLVKMLAIQMRFRLYINSAYFEILTMFIQMYIIYVGVEFLL